jgi:glutathione reductase (NADPH)
MTGYKERQEMINYDYDYFVIGGGSGGVRSARIAASHGAKVGLAEGKHLGGTCVNVGCVPKKLMAYAADFQGSFEDARGFGWIVGETSFDWQTFIERKNEEIQRLNGIYQSLLSKAGVTIYQEFASFIDAHTLQVGSETITAKHILIATGGKPRELSFDGAEHMIVSDDAFYLENLPEHVVIYGGGYIGVEFAHIFSGMGAKVTLVHRGDLFLRGFDDDIRCHLRDEMKKQGVNLIFETEISKIDKDDSTYLVTLTDENNTVIQCDCVMSAVGRVPNIGSLGLVKAGVETDSKNYIQVNDRYQTSIDHIYAVGDVTGNMELTPIAIREGQWLSDTLFGGKDLKPIKYDTIPTAVFSRPQIGSVGLTEAEAIDKGFDIQIFKNNFNPMAYSLTDREERTLMKMIVDKATDKILGLHICGLDAAEMMQGFGVAINAGLTKADFDATIGIHPTSAEEVVTLR